MTVLGAVHSRGPPTCFRHFPFRRLWAAVFLCSPLWKPSHEKRATVLCQRGDRILLVARLNARWVLPGGKPHRGETLGDAARRELAEETGIVCRAVRPLFQLAGGNKRHHVFVADIEASAIARPAQEIAHCAWFDRQTIASIDCSRPTPFIVKRALKILDDERYVMAYMEAMLLQAAA